ncbi:MAG: coproporphyrinogen III oxidase [Alphaproteobacteria bacterium]|nr:coproporphyrinogen III oxidase [Alphaproteobacteria bacterium]
MPEGGFGLYVHWPFCAAKCPYCDFNSHVRREVDAMAYARGLVRELETTAARLDARPALNSIFFGGGTPSLMPGAAVGAVIDAAARLFPFAADIEVTLEANPTSVDAGRFADYAAAGVNRVSMGVQALNDTDLKALGRWHSAAEARAAFEVARRVFERVSFDLIYARPGQSAAAWEAELAEALAMAVDHLSLYQLTIEDGTKFGALHAAGQLVVPDGDTAASLYELTQEICAGAGMPQYEISNHARAGAQSRHNLVYWRYGEFVGVGPGAHGRIRSGEALWATSTERRPEAWLRSVEATGDGLVSRDAVDPADQAREYLVMCLRLAEGLDIARYERLAGRPFDAARFAALAEEGLVIRREGRLFATLRGRLVLNAVAAELAR